MVLGLEFIRLSSMVDTMSADTVKFSTYMVLSSNIIDEVLLNPGVGLFRECDGQGFVFGA